MSKNAVVNCDICRILYNVYRGQAFMNKFSPQNAAYFLDLGAYNYKQ